MSREAWVSCLLFLLLSFLSFLTFLFLAVVATATGPLCEIPFFPYVFILIPLGLLARSPHAQARFF